MRPPRFYSRCVSALLVVVLLVCLATARPALATVYQLEDLNSAALVDADSSVGMSSWTVDGTENLFQQWFWIRLGDGAEQSIDTIDLDEPLADHQDNDYDPGKESLQLRYEGSGLRIDVSLELTGGTWGSGVSDLLEAISIHNIGDEELDLHLFQYVDFNLGGTSEGDTGEIIVPFGVIQTEGAVYRSETADAPAPNRYEIGLTPVILDKLEDDDADDLNNSVGPITGDVSWAFQWDFVLEPGGSFIISKNKHLTVPEPYTLALLLTGVFALLKRWK